MDFQNFPLNPNIGALQIGFLASGFLFGVLTVQALIYNRKYAKDPWALKLLVAVIWTFELGQLGCTAHALYVVTITQSGNLLAVLSPPRTIGGSFLLGSAVGPLIEAFYVSRLLRFSGHLYVAVIGWFLAFARFGGWIFLATRVILMSSLSEWENDYGWLFSMLLGISAVVDLAISAWIAYFLARRRSRGTVHNESVRQLLDRVILWTLQTGVITSLAFLVTLVSYLILGQYLIWLAVLAILTKVSSNCFLASLNARSSTRFQGRSKSDLGGRHTVSRPRGTGLASSHIRGGSASQHHTAHSLVGNIIELYQLPNDDENEYEHGLDRVQRDDASSHFHFQTINRPRGHRHRTSFGEHMNNDRSAFSPDGTIVSVASSRPSEYWAL